MRVAAAGSVEADQTLGLRALAAVAADERLLVRFLDVSGLAPADLRGRAGEPATLASLLAFLEAHEPDLVAVAAMIGVGPERLVAARAGLEAA